MSLRTKGFQTLFLFGALTALGAMPLLAQDTPYTASEYNAYMKVHDAKSVDEKESTIFEFLDWYSKSSLMPNVMYELQVYLDTLFKNNQLDKVEAVAKRLLEFHAVAKDTAERALARVCLLRKDMPGFLTYSEAIYNRAPTTQMACELAITAYKAKDAARQDRFTADVLAKGSTREKADLFNTFFLEYTAVGDNEKAMAAARKVVEILDVPEKPADFSGNWESYQVEVLNPALGMIGMAHFKAKEYPQAVETLSKIIKRNPKDASTYYYLGAAYLNQQIMRQAAENYACAAVLNVSPVSENALKMIREIIKATESDERALDAYLQKAKERLSIQ